MATSANMPTRRSRSGFSSWYRTGSVREPGSTTEPTSMSWPPRPRIGKLRPGWDVSVKLAAGALITRSRSYSDTRDSSHTRSRLMTVNSARAGSMYSPSATWAATSVPVSGARSGTFVVRRGDSASGAEPGVEPV
jgi:hypothetical protein